jgi:hypothetical protein
LAAKRLELLREALPSVAVIAFMINPTNPRAKVNTSELQAAAQAARQNILIVNVNHESEFDAAFATLTQKVRGCASSRWRHSVQLSTRAAPSVGGASPFARKLSSA